MGKKEGLTGGRLLCAVVRRKTATLGGQNSWPPLWVWSVLALCNLNSREIQRLVQFDLFSCGISIWSESLYWTRFQVNYLFLDMVSCFHGSATLNVFLSFARRHSCHLFKTALAAKFPCGQSEFLSPGSLPSSRGPCLLWLCNGSIYLLPPSFTIPALKCRVLSWILWVKFWLYGTRRIN